MARQTFSAKVGRCLGSAQLHVRVMTCDTTQAAIAPVPAPAHFHLLPVAERLDDTDLWGYGRAEDGNHIPQRRSRPEIQIRLTGTQDLCIPQKMALIAHVIAKLRRQVHGIDDRKINRAPERSILSAFAHVDFPWPMAPFTTHS